MVDLGAVRKSNSALQGRPQGWIAVFVGATRGIGASTLKHLVRSLSKFYVIGRSEAKFSHQRAELEALNPSAVIIFVQAEITLLRSVDAVCKKIAARESRIDLLFMSAGFLAFGGPHYTSEGIDKCAALSYYSRMRFTSNLLPLLRRAPSPRILSVLAGGEERPILTHDLGLAHNYTIVNVVNHATTMHTLAFEHLAQSNPTISFIHAHPGWVHTDLVNNLFTPKKESWSSPLYALIRWVAAVFFMAFGISAEEAGVRQAFHATSSSYPSRKTIEAGVRDPRGLVPAEYANCSVPGNGVYRLSWTGEGVVENSVLDPYRRDRLPEDIWDFTVRVIENSVQGEKSP